MVTVTSLTLTRSRPWSTVGFLDEAKYGHVDLCIQFMPTAS